MNEDGEVRPVGADRWVEALTWYYTLREAKEKDLAGGLASEWRHWYADAENQRTFSNVSRLLADRSRYRHRGLPSQEELEADRYDLAVPVAEWRKAHAPHMKQKGCVSGGNWLRRLSCGVAAAATAVVVMFWLPRSWSTGKSRRDLGQR